MWVDTQKRTNKDMMLSHIEGQIIATQLRRRALGTSVRESMEFWLRRADGQESYFHFYPCVPVNEGQKVTVIHIVTDDKKTNPLLSLITQIKNVTLPVQYSSGSLKLV